MPRGFVIGSGREASLTRRTYSAALLAARLVALLAARRGGVPRRVHLGQIAVFWPFAALCQLVLHPCKARGEFEIRILVSTACEAKFKFANRTRNMDLLVTFLNLTFVPCALKNETKFRFR